MPVKGKKEGQGWAMKKLWKWGGGVGCEERERGGGRTRERREGARCDREGRK